MTRALVHRGPDGEGFHLDGAAALGHRRLSILDLERGAQPMVREGVVLLFNGEAYEHAALREELRRQGHSFTTRSDAEVVLRAYLQWGPQFLQRVHGMFALALWDARERRLLLARDRLGKKPLYYALAGPRKFLTTPGAEATRCVFASELKALGEHSSIPRELDVESVCRYLALEYVPAPRSIHRHVFKLPAAHMAVLDGSGFRVQRYWELPAPAPFSGTSQEASEELLRLLDAAVARRLVADVPVGALLSGGIDSTGVVALARRHQDPLRTYSIGFDEPEFDETPFALLASRQLGTVHRTERLRAEDCVGLLSDAVATLDEPFADPSVLPTLLLCRLAHSEVKVAMVGDGGDELFAGYDPFLAHRPALLAARCPAALRHAAYGLASRLPSSDEPMSAGFRLTRFMRGLDEDAAVRHQAWIGAFLPSELAQVLVPDVRPLAAPPLVYREVLAEAERSLGAGVLPESIDGALRFYLSRYLPDDILVKGDRAAMASSLELRAPFLDTHVVEFVSRLPSHLKVTLTQTKVLLRRALRAHVPAPILRRPKKGFGIPVARWIRGPLRPLFEELLGETALRRTGLFDPAHVRGMLDRHLAGADLRKPLWTLAMFQLWKGRWGVA